MTTYNMDLAEDALEAAETYVIPRITDEADQVMILKPNRLFYHPSNEWKVSRLLRTTAGRVGTPNNDVNLVQGRYNPTPLWYMDSARAAYWMLKDDDMNNMPGHMVYLESQGLQKDGPYIDFDTKGIKYSWDILYGAGHNEWRSYPACSQGDNT